MYAIIAIVAVTSYLVAAKPVDNVTLILPNLLKCNLHQPSTEICIQSSIESMKPYLIDGIPQLDIPSFEPYRTIYTYASIKDYYGTTMFRNITVNGLSSFSIRNIRVSADMSHIKLKVHFPLIQFSGNYSVQGSISDAVVVGGPYAINGNFTHVTAHIIMNGIYYQNENDSKKRYFRMVNVIVSLKVKGTKIIRHTELNYPTDKQFYLDKHWEIVKPKMRLNSKISRDILANVNKIYSSFPIDMLVSL